MRFHAFALAAVIAISAGCATTTEVPDRAEIGDALRTRTGSAIRPAGGPASLPPNVSLADGLTRDEAVAIALWNSPAFEASLADLGLARADVVEAGLLRNPILSLLFPVGPKQYEWTLQFPLDALVQRPRRVAAATRNAQAVGQRLVSEGLTLVADVRRAYVEAIAGERRVALGTESADVAARIAGITDARLRAGDISELEARAARSDAAEVAAGVKILESDRDLAKLALIERMGFETPLEQVRLTPGALESLTSCGPADALIEDALSSRPDVRAAEIAIEAAGQRARWERSRVFTLIAGLDANGQGSEGFELGPGLNGELPILARNQGGISRANAEIERASRLYVNVRMQVAAEVRAASLRFAQAQQTRQTWDVEIVPSLEAEQRQAEIAYQGGEAALTSLLDVRRRLVVARVRQLEAGLDALRAAVALDRSVGHTCAR